MRTPDYVNSRWEDQAYPYRGDALNAYNDGPLTDGTQMGPFYELEASSPAVSLLPGAAIRHTQTTYHITGSSSALNAIAVTTLGLDISEIESAFR